MLRNYRVKHTNLCQILDREEISTSGSERLNVYVWQPNGSRHFAFLWKTFFRFRFYRKTKQSFVYTFAFKFYFHFSIISCRKPCVLWSSSSRAMFGSLKRANGHILSKKLCKKGRKSNFINLSELVWVRFFMNFKDQCLYDTVI